VHDNNILAIPTSFRLLTELRYANFSKNILVSLALIPCRLLNPPVANPRDWTEQEVQGEGFIYFNSKTRQTRRAPPAELRAYFEDIRAKNERRRKLTKTRAAAARAAKRVGAANASSGVGGASGTGRPSSTGSIGSPRSPGGTMTVTVSPIKQHRQVPEQSELQKKAAEKAATMEAKKNLHAVHMEWEVKMGENNDGVQFVHLKSGNTFPSIPKELDNLHWLVKLRRASFAINGIYIVPDSIGLMVGLEELDLSHNHLNNIPDTVRHLGAVCWCAECWCSVFLHTNWYIFRFCMLHKVFSYQQSSSSPLLLLLPR
jgi:hypothetical protein